MGCYRLFLACLVVYSHVVGKLFGVDVGESAVVSFFILSGYTMTALIDRHYNGYKGVIPFYVDRFIRLAPQFYFYSMIVLVLFFFFGIRHQFLHQTPGIISVIAQFMIFPNNFYWIFDDILIPQSWSLGHEMMFYIIFPFILLCRLRAFFAIASFCIFGIAYLGFLNKFNFMYILLPGTLFMFIIGSFIRYNQNKSDKIQLIFYFSFTFILLIIAFSVQGYTQAIHKAITIGIIFCGISIYFFNKINIKGSFDKICGDLSYGVYLNHNLILGIYWLLFNNNKPVSGSGKIVFFFVLTASLAASYISLVFIERPFAKWRYKMRSPILQEEIAKKVNVALSSPISIFTCSQPKP